MIDERTNQCAASEHEVGRLRKSEQGGKGEKEKEERVIGR